MFGFLGSLIGGLVKRHDKRQAVSRQNAYNSPEQIRARAEKAGFNPLLFVGPGVGNQVVSDYSPALGDAIQNAGALEYDYRAEKKKLDLDRTKLEQQKQRFQQAANAALINPKVQGVYGDAQTLARQSAYQKTTDGQKSRLSGVVTKTPPGEYLYEGEEDRLEVGAGGTITDQNIYQRKGPFGFDWYVERPGAGEAAEQDYSDVGGNITAMSYMLTDVYHNLNQERYDGRKWVPIGRYTTTDVPALIGKEIKTRANRAIRRTGIEKPKYVGSSRTRAAAGGGMSGRKGLYAGASIMPLLK